MGNEVKELAKAIVTFAITEQRVGIATREQEQRVEEAELVIALTMATAAVAQHAGFPLVNLLATVQRMYESIANEPRPEGRKL